ncbi:MAG: hypothetical protein LC775_15810 [Acidobacteria bacterium]|nr:hypothetical protein [Acidobacteriota bacterium]
MACEESQVQQTDPEQQGSGVTEAPRSEEEGAVRYAEATALVEAGNPDALAQTKQSAACTTREGRSPDGSARIGDFVRPDSVPGYEIFDLPVDQERAGREGARVAELLVDTRTKSEADYALIARDIKVRYSGYDAVMVEFTDLSVEGIPYNGGALIFNTPCGALSLGYVYGPPNTDGYVVAAGGPPPLYPFQGATDAANTKARN